MAKYVFLFSVLFPCFVFAGPSLDQYRKNPDDPLLNMYLYGTAEGLSYANAHNINKNMTPIYCQPNKLALNGHNYIQIFKTYLETDEAKLIIRSAGSDVDISFLLMFALRNTFPCEK